MHELIDSFTQGFWPYPQSSGKPWRILHWGVTRSILCILRSTLVAVLKNCWGKGHERKQRPIRKPVQWLQWERQDMAYLEWHLRKLDNLRDILELKSRRLGSNWYQHEKILGKLLISDLSSWVKESFYFYFLDLMGIIWHVSSGKLERESWNCRNVAVICWNDQEFCFK